MTSLPVPSTLVTLPITLRDWRISGWKPKGTYPRDVWTPLEQFFLEQGLILWKKETRGKLTLYTSPPNDLPRCPDGFVYSTLLSETRPWTSFALVKAVHCPARTIDNRDVLVRLIAKADDGLNHLTALRRLATGLVAFRGENHILPMLREIVLDDMVFAVFPLMQEGFDTPWYYNHGELVDAVYQVIEGLTFCHERLVAHLDIDSDNILINFTGGSRQEGVTENKGVRGPPSPFRECFPVRYYLNDFELAACFDPESDPSTRIVTGLPVKHLRGTYGREIAPEMLSEQSYCPFRADVWQLGRMFLRCFQHLDEPWTPLTKLFIEMSSMDPLSRPTLSRTLERVREFRSTLSTQSLASRVPRPPPEPPSSPMDETLKVDARRSGTGGRIRTQDI